MLTTLVAVLLSLPAVQLGTASIVAAFMLSVTISAVAGGLWGGLFAAVLASLAVPVLEEPDLVLRIDDPRDVVAVTVFFAIAVVVGIIVGNAADERARASRREREARLLASLSTRLFAGEVAAQVVDDFVGLLLEPFALRAATVEAMLDGQPIRAHAEIDADDEEDGPVEVVPVAAGGVVFGTLTVVRLADRRPMSRDEKLLLEAAARQAGAALDRARLDARARLAQVDAETNLLRASMFSSVTHDLRTPLASIKAGVTSLLDESTSYDPSQQHELLVTILEETDRLNRLVGNILDLAKIRAGALIPRRSRIALDEVTEAVVARLRRRADEEAVSVELAIPPNVPDIAADPLQIDQVLTNLLENALRHSPSGSVVRIHLSVIPRGIRIRITDQGPGVPHDDREKVFEAFYRGDVPPETAGTGLGLAIARAIVVAHGGRIWIEDAVGGGAAMVVELPLEEVVAR
jgi:two-component system sensor histidine kinase KdpD